MKRIFIFAFLLIMLSGCANNNQPLTTEYVDVLDTFSTLTVYGVSKDDFKTISDNLHKELQRYDKLFSIYNDYDGINNIKTINDNAGKQPVSVDKDIINLLNDSKEYYTQTNGKMNVAMGAVLSVWHNYREAALDGNPALPTAEELKNGAQHIDINNLVTDDENNTVFLSDEKASLDVGAVAKGYIADKAVEFLKNNGVETAILSLGGNVVTIGTPPNKPAWTIGIQNPDNENADYIDTINIEEESAVTSGDYQRYYEYNGKRYCHIIDVDTLYPAEKYKSVTVITEKSELADAMSTALFVTDYEDGKKIADEMGLKVIWVMGDNSLKKNF